MSNIWFEKEHLDYFYEAYRYNGYALVNEIYEDEDCRKNTWMWGELHGDYILNARILTGLSSNSYAPFEEVWNVFTKLVDIHLESV